MTFFLFFLKWNLHPLIFRPLPHFNANLKLQLIIRSPVRVSVGIVSLSQNSHATVHQMMMISVDDNNLWVSLV